MGSPHINIDEKAPCWDVKSSEVTPYELSKVRAEQLVLDANSHSLPTTALRLVLTYGERDSAMVPSLLPAFYNKQTNIQLGDGTNLHDYVYAGNAGKAHILAAKALLSPNRANGKVDGEAFNITDGEPRRFWDIMRLVWRAAGDKTQLEDVTVVPAWLAVMMAQGAEWIFWIFTLGRKRPQLLNVLIVKHSVLTHTYDITKARKRLGYEPVPDMEGGILRTVEWELRKQRGKEREKDY